MKPVNASVSAFCVSPAWTSATGRRGFLASTDLAEDLVLLPSSPLAENLALIRRLRRHHGRGFGWRSDGCPELHDRRGRGCRSRGCRCRCGRCRCRCRSRPVPEPVPAVPVPVPVRPVPELVRPVPVPVRPVPELAVPASPESASPGAASPERPVPESASEESASPEPSDAAVTEPDARALSDCGGCVHRSRATTRARSRWTDRAEPLQRLQLPKCGWKLVWRTLDLLVLDGRREFLT